MKLSLQLPPPKATLGRRVAAEFLGTAFLVAAIVGSGIMGERLSNSNVAFALLANTLATGAALVALILAFAPISGAHLNPVVSVAHAIEGGLSWAQTPPYVLAQILGGVAGTVAANAMFGIPVVSISRHVRAGPAQFLSEFIATFGLLAVVWGCSRSRANAVAFGVGCYITAAYWFTASTSFANPAVTIARALSDTFAGIRPADVLLFILAQFAGGIAATFLFRWLTPHRPMLESNPENALVDDTQIVERSV
jgi:glycerol uptake facilitator-like aquaporin